MSELPPDDFIPLELDAPTGDDGIPAWVATLLVAIGAIVPIPPDVAFTALQALLGPITERGARRRDFVALPGFVQARVRSAKDAKLALINASRSESARAPEAREIPVAPVAPTATTRQAIPVVTVPTTTPALARPLNGTWTRIQNGPHAGEWGGRIDNVQSMQVGQAVRLYKRGARRGSLHIVVAFGMRDGAAICAVREATADETYAAAQANVRASDEQSDDAIPTNASEREPSGPTVAAESAQEPSGATDNTPITVEASLASVVDQGAALVAPQAPSYARTIAATTSGNGGIDQPFQTNGSTFTPTGPSVFDLPRSERAAFRVQASQTSSDVRSLIGERDFIAGAVADGSMLQASWTGGGQTTLGKVTDALVEIEREDDAPGSKSAVAYAGDAVTSMRSREYDTYRRPNGALTNGTKAQWVIGRKAGRTVTAGDAYGEVLLVVSLRDDDTLAFDGDSGIASSVRSRYAAMVKDETLKSDTLTAWLGRTLRTRHGAVKRGHVWYIPGGQANAARALIDAIAPLWGDHEHIPVTTGPDLMRSLTRGLLVEAQAVCDDLAEATTLAKQRARAKAEKEARERYGSTDATVAAAGDLAERRGVVSSTVAARLLADLGKVAARVAGYETMLGADSTRDAKALITTLRETLAPLTDDTSARAAMLELD